MNRTATVKIDKATGCVRCYVVLPLNEERRCCRCQAVVDQQAKRLADDVALTRILGL